MAVRHTLLLLTTMFLMTKFWSKAHASDMLLQDQVDNLTSRLEKLVRHVDEVTAKNAQLETEVQGLRVALNAQQAEQASLQGQVEELRQGEVSMAGVLHDVHGSVALLNRTFGVTGFGKRQVQPSQAPPSVVGFTAVISPPDLTNLNPGQAIVYDKVITNIGNGYDPSTGIFTATVSGLFVFNMAVLVEPGENEYLELVKDGRHVLYNYGHASGSLHDASSSRTVVVQLQEGSQVWVRTSPSAQHGSGTIHGNDFTTFSGFLIGVL